MLGSRLSLKLFSIFMNLTVVPTPPLPVMFVSGNVGFACGETQDAGGEFYSRAVYCQPIVPKPVI